MWGATAETYHVMEVKKTQAKRDADSAIAV
ncbi:hypothetical protein SPV1_09208 [Mariprofundus ferrooxydans PV-1]|uniref:Uncharacterized protein n=1 Tax=Mariprofundus ferrooxydans PV-1 TaxID=314345 RepID=Q0F023_9PROT|nr:hypothetical protein SPV1_09208 [Mariprofundus ferrooxydans PV-1]